MNPKGSRKTSSPRTTPITPRGMVDELVSHVDVFPTLAELGKAEAPSKLDGISIVPVLQGNKGERDYG